MRNLFQFLSKYQHLVLFIFLELIALSLIIQNNTFHIPVPFIPTSINFEASFSRGFLWFGGAGAIFKGLDLVSNIKVYDYKWKSADERTYGVVAHELQEVLPQAVDGNKDDEQMQGVDYSKIVPLLVKSIQELKAEIELLKNK